MAVAGESAAPAGPASGAYLSAFVDWLACARGGLAEPAAVAARHVAGEDLPGRVMWAATAGHVLDYDDTFSPGVAHVSAPTAPAALLATAQRGGTLGEAVAAYAAGFDAMAAVAAASHPALYDRGWHPTAVCGPIGAAVATAHALGLPDAAVEQAVLIGLLGSGGVRGAFGSDGKALQVGMAAAAGVRGALLASAGANVDRRALEGELGFTGVLGATWARPGDAQPAIDANWIKLHPSCLGTHAPIEAADAARTQLGPGHRVIVTVHPVARQAAHLDTVSDGLSAKFSIPYCVAFTLRHGPPRLPAFTAVDPQAAADAPLIEVEVDPSLPQFGAVLHDGGGRELVRVPCPLGAPERPIGPEALRAKVIELGGQELLALCADPDVPAATMARAALE